MHARFDLWLAHGLLLALPSLGGTGCSDEVIITSAERTPPGRETVLIDIQLSISAHASGYTTADTVTLVANASGDSAVASISIEVNDTVRHTCTGATCSYASTFSVGTHVYTATAIDRAGRLHESEPRTFTIRPEPSDPQSPLQSHWRHMRTAVVDYRLHYNINGVDNAEKNWAASHYDHVTGGRLENWKPRNANVQMAVYDLLWAPGQNSVGRMEGWLTSNGYNPESAYLHVAGTTPERANRLSASIWDKDRWIVNPGDRGFIAWRHHITGELTASDVRGHGFSTLFIDEMNASVQASNIPEQTLEYPSRAAYWADLNALLEQTRQSAPAGFLIINAAAYWSRTGQDRNAILAAGGVMAEFANSPFIEQKWDAADDIVAGGAVLEFSTGVSPGSKNDAASGLTPGNYLTIEQRVLIWEYASYLMIVDPNRMDAVLFEPYSKSWARPLPEVWLKAWEYDIGLATGRRRVHQDGTDGAGQPYQVWARDFENALVLIRPIYNYRHKDLGDATAVTVTLPAGSWRMLLADGGASEPLSSLELRNGEAVVLVR